jgi:hypothetical protein
MGFKVDSSFLKFLTMGALGVRKVAVELRAMGFEPIELERYCASNKIWATKVKRLRLADLLCVKTGLRVEVRAKSDLKIRMSDAPNNPERTWDAGLRDQDVIALIACSSEGPVPLPADHAVYFTAKVLRDSVADSRLGPPKSASEGAERDRTWPAIVPSRSGKVSSIENGKLVVSMEGDGQPARKQTYSLAGKHAYVAPGQSFVADASILAGAPSELADLTSRLTETYQPLQEAVSINPLDRYAAAKALRFRTDLRDAALPLLEGELDREQDIRVTLEVAGSACALGSLKGQEKIAEILWSEDAPEMSMEAILLLTELGSGFATDQLREVVKADRFQSGERRQAAIWGLGKAGAKSYGDLVPLIGDADDNSAYHAIAGFGQDSPPPVITALINLLTGDNQRRAAAASEALRMIGSQEVLKQLVGAAGAGVTVTGKSWVLATLGKLSPDSVRAALSGNALLAQLEPMLLSSPSTNWLAQEDRVADLVFLHKQSLPT